MENEKQGYIKSIQDVKEDEKQSPTEEKKETKEEPKEDLAKEEPIKEVPIKEDLVKEEPKEEETKTIKKNFNLQINLDFFKRHWKLISIVCASLFVISGSAFGFNFYSKYIQPTPIEKILPGNPNVVMTITIDPDSEQFKLLEENMRKFPGYTLLQKEIDKVGEGKTLSKSIQDKLKEYNLDFDQDVKAALDDTAFVEIPDLSPLGDNIQKKAILSFSELKENQQIDGGPRVAGESTSNLYVQDEEPVSERLNYIVGAKIKDLEKAKEILDKMKGKDSKYVISELKFDGYTYYKFTQKEPNESENELAKLFNYAEVYQALLGSNWIMASKEQDMKDMISRKAGQEYLGQIAAKKDKSSLFDDADYQNTFSKVAEEKSQNLLGIYYKINFEDLFEKDENCRECFSITDYIKYPETIISTAKIRLTPDGVHLESASNKSQLDDIQGIESNGLTSKIPQKINNKWTNILFEYDKPKNFYYSFKRNNLTEKGLNSWNEAIDSIYQTTKIDIEKDFIDQVSGNAGFAIFTNNSEVPEMAGMLEVKDAGLMRNTMKKITDLAKQYYTSFYGSLSRGNVNADQSKKMKAELDQIIKTEIIETNTDYGKIYSFKLPNSDFSFDFSLEDNNFILASNYATVESLMREFKSNQEKKVADNDLFKKASQFSFPKSYSNTFVCSDGIANMISYGINKSSSIAGQPMEKKTEDSFFALGAIFRTMKLINDSRAVDGQMAKSSLFINIQELPKEEKDRAEKILEKGLDF